MSEPVDTGTPPDPEFFLNTETGEVTVDWHGPRPEQVLMSGEVMERTLNERNQLVATIAGQKALLEQQAERVRKMVMLLAILRLGRRPSRADWDSVELPRLTQEVRMDLMSRKRRPSR